MNESEDESPVIRAEPTRGASSAARPGLPSVSDSQLPIARLERRRPRFALLAFGLIVLLAGTFGAWWTWLRTPPLTGFAVGNGRIEATEIDVATKLPGRVEAVWVNEGDSVEVGQALAKLEVSALEARLAEAEAAHRHAIEVQHTASATLQMQESLRRLAQKEFARASALYSAKVASEDDRDRRRTALETADASLDHATQQWHQAQRAIEVAAARVERIRIDISDATLVAPGAGRVLYRLVEPGEVLPAGGKVVSLVDEQDVYMTVFLPEQAAAQVRIGTQARLRLDGFPATAWPASVSFVAPKAQFTPKQVETASEREKLAFKIKIQLPQPVDPVIKPGMRGVATVRLDPEAAWPDTLP